MARNARSMYQTNSDATKFVSVAQVYNNTGQQLIMITEDKMRLCLIRYVQKLDKKTEWQAPFGIFLAVITTKLTSDFHDFFSIKAAVWEAIFLVLGLLSFFWFCLSLKHVCCSVSIEDIMADLKVNSKIDSVGVPQVEGTLSKSNEGFESIAP